MNWKQAFALGLIAPGEWDGKGEPVAYLYNGVRLPKLPEWDRETYPYACIATTSGGATYFVANSSPFVASDYGGFAQVSLPVEYELDKYNPDHWNEGISDVVIVGAIVWTNTDLYFSSGNLCLVASEPVPSYTEIIYEKMLYNGIKLPKLPDWDKETYPYAVFGVNHEPTNEIRFCACKSIPYYHQNSGAVCLRELESFLYAYTIPTGDVWSKVNANADPVITQLFVSEPMWANVNIVDADGNLVISASEPEPIYE